MASDASSSVTKHLHALFRTGTAIGLTDGSLARSVPERRGRRGRGGVRGAGGATRSDGPARLPADPGRSSRRRGRRAGGVPGAGAAGAFDPADRLARKLALWGRRAGRARGRDSMRPGVGCANERVRSDRWRSGTSITPSTDGSETWPELYEELGRLPERFRMPIVLCHLEGLTYEQAAERLGCPVRTIQSRLARGRERLRSRLTRRGVAPAIAALTADLTPDAASAAVSESWKHATVTAAVRYAAGGTAAALIPSTVAVLAEGASTSHELASSDEMGGGLVVDRRRRGRRGDGDAGAIGAAGARAARLPRLRTKTDTA